MLPSCNNLLEEFPGATAPAIWHQMAIEEWYQVSSESEPLSPDSHHQYKAKGGSTGVVHEIHNTCLNLKYTQLAGTA